MAAQLDRPVPGIMGSTKLDGSGAPWPGGGRRGGALSRELLGNAKSLPWSGIFQLLEKMYLREAALANGTPFMTHPRRPGAITPGGRLLPRRAQRAPGAIGFESCFSPHA